MATSSSAELGGNYRPKRRVQSLGEFILTKRVPRRGKKGNLGIKKLINKFEHKLVPPAHTPGSILAAPSAPSYEEGDSDCESWGSDFDDDAGAENTTWEEPQEEIENDINSMLEAAMERTRNLENSRFARNEGSQQLNTGSGACLEAAGIDFTTSSDAPPLPPRNPGRTFNMPPGKVNPRSVISLPKVENASSINESLLGSANEVPERKKQPTRVIPSPESGMTQPSLPSSSMPGVRTTGSTPNMEPQVASSSPRTNRIFPPDVANGSSPFSLGSSAITEAKATSVLGGGARAVDARRDPTNSTNVLRQGPKVMSSNAVLVLPQPNFPAAEHAEPHETSVISMPPPLPSRPPPLPSRPPPLPSGPPPSGPPPLPSGPPPLPSGPPPKPKFPVNKPEINNITFGLSDVSSTPEHNSRLKNHPRQLPLNSVVMSQINKNTASGSPSKTNLAENSLQNSSVLESAELVCNNASGTASANRDNTENHQKRSPKSKPGTFTTPKFIRELDTAVMNQAMPKSSTRCSSISENEMQQSAQNSRNFSSSENTEKAENSLSDEYLNPKNRTSSTSGPTQFVPDRPTLPRRLKQSRSLPQLFKTNPKVATDENSHQKLQLQQPQVATNETPENAPQFAAATEEVFRQPWYHPVTWEQAQFKLTAMGLDGAFVVRPSRRVSQGVPYTVSVFFRGRIINCHISCTPDGKYVLGKLKPNQKPFDTITELIRYYQSTPAELKVSEAEPVSKVCLLITPPKDIDKIYADV